MEMRLRFLLLASMGASVLVIASGCQKNVSTARAPVPQQAASSPQKRSIEELLDRLMDAHFDHDRSDLRNDALSALSQDSNEIKMMLSEFPEAKFIVEGHCDEQGSTEYQLGLGERRAAAV